MKDLLQDLVETPGVSGDEARIREVVEEKIDGETEVDDFGNLIARKGSGSPRLMVMAHIDQIGLAVRRIDENGYLKVSKTGGMFEMGVVNQRFNVHTDEGELTGVAASKPPHLLKGDDANPREIPEMKNLFIDVGAEDAEEAREMGVNVGDFVTYDRGLDELGNDLVTAPAFDDRAGVAALIEAFNSFDGGFELVAVFSTQEEVGTKGAMTSTYGVDPDVALAVDTGIAGDVPGVEPDEADAELGDGVGFDLQQSGGRGLVAPQKIRNWLVDTAEQNDVEFFRSVTTGGATDARSIELQRDGVPTGSLSIPTRNIHSPCEVLKLSDLEETVQMLQACFTTVDDYFE